MGYKTMDAAAVAALLPRRDRYAHKGEFGRLLLVTGSVGFTGASALAARAALRTGAGLITVAVPQAVWPIVAGKLDEPMVVPEPDDGRGRFSQDAREDLLARLAGADACMIGPGIGRSEALTELVLALLEHARCPVVLDADGINAVAGHIDRLRELACPLILTPHDGEFARLCPGTTLDKRDEPARVQAAAALARKLGAAAPSTAMRPATPVWPKAAAGMCWRGSLPRFWGRVWLRCRPLRRVRGSTAPRETGVPRSGASMA